MENVLKETRVLTASCAFKRDLYIPIAKLAKMYYVLNSTLHHRIAVYT